jgi:YD repeat-containing protein
MNRIATNTRRLQAATSFLPVVVFFTLLLTNATVAQTTTSSATDMKTPAGLTPGAPAGSYALSGFDSVNPYNGNLNFRLPLVRIGGRGAAGYTIMLALNSKRWRVRYSSTIGAPNVKEEIFQTWTPTTSHWNGREVGYRPGVLVGRQVGVDYRDPRTCLTTQRVYKFTLTRLVFTTPDGTEYELRDQATNGQPQEVPQSACSNPTAPGFDRGRIFTTADGSSITFISDSVIYDENRPNSVGGVWFIYPSGYLLMRDGTRYRIENGDVRWIRDRNGNKVTTNGSDTTDSVGRNVSVTERVEDVAPYGLCDKISFKGANGEERIIRVSRDRLSNALRAGYTIQTYAQLFPTLNGANNYQPNTFDPPDFVSSVWLPDGRRYRLFYNPYGELARVELPTGGAIEYDHTPDSGVLTTGALGEEDRQIYRRVIERRTYSDGVTLTGKMLYSTGGITYKDANGVTLSAEGASYISPYGAVDSLFWPSSLRLYGDWTEGRANVSAVGIGGVAMRTTTTNWQQRAPVSWLSWWNSPTLDRGSGYPDDNPANDPLAVETITTLNETNQVAKTTSINPSTGAIHFDDYNNPLDVWEYDFGTGAPGALLRRTHTDYLTAGYDTIAGGAANPDLNATIHIRNLPIQNIVYGASGNVSSQTDFIYDDYGVFPLVDCPGIVQHDGGFHTGYGARGNLTGMILRNPDGSPSEIHLNNQYDIAGNLVKSVDGRGIATDFDFSDRFGSPDDEARSNAGAPELAGGLTYAFPTKVTNALGHTAHTQYDYYLGALVNSEDANGMVSSVTYNDALDRPTQGIQARYVVGVGVPAMRRQMTITYDDTNRVITTTGDRDTFKDNILTGKAYYDGLGRTWRGATYEGSTWSITDTQFDALSRVSQVSNPYRAADPDSASPPSGAFAEWTTTDYDALGRVIRVTTPDGAHVDTAYSGNQVTVTDQAVKKRRSETDALGRLIKITEDPGGLNYDTYYSYDALDNLRLVTQGAQTRTFVYDSLSRLISAANPESGTMTYAYDSNGNLIEKTDARGVRTTMTYDALNRARSKVYAGTTPEGTAAANATPRVNYFYDDYSTAPSGAPSWPGTPSKGRLTGVTYGPGSEGTYYKYDAAGRIVTNHQRMGTSNYATAYFYNLASGVTREERGIPARRRILMSYDAAGRLATVDTGAYPFLAYVPLVHNISYTPFGGLQSETYGNGLIHSMSYNNRLQPTEIRLGRSDNLESVFRLGYIFGTADNVNGQDYEIMPAHNNGNVARIKYLISGTVQYTQTFQYDALNRLQLRGGTQQRRV